MRRLVYIVASSLSIGVSAFSVAGGEVAASATTKQDELSICLMDSDRPLGVLFVVDTSQSLTETDPGAAPARVKGLSSAVEALGKVAEGRDVYVETIKFGTGFGPAFSESEWPEWGEVGDDAEVLARLMTKFASLNRSEDTDYGSALLGAREALDKRSLPDGACRLVVWFTDGKFDLDYQGRKKTVEWMDPDGTLEKAADEDPVNRAAKNQICAANGIVDELRGLRDSVEDGAPYVVGVTLGSRTSDFDFFDEIVTNRAGDCGSRPAFGTVLNASNVDELVESLIRAADPSIGQSPIDSFSVSEALQSLRLRVDWDSTTSVPMLVDPDGESVDIGATRAVTLKSGAQVTVDLEAPTQAMLSLEFPGEVAGWDGVWSFKGSDARAPRGELFLQGARGELRVSLEADTVIRRGRPSPVVLSLVGPNGEPRTGEAWHPSSTLLLSSNPTAEDLDTEVVPADDGKVRLTVDLGTGFASSTLELFASVTPVVEVLPGVITALTEWLDQPIGTTAVKDLPRSPIVDPPAPFTTPFDQDHLVLETTVPVEAAGPESGGCIAIESVATKFSGAPTGVVHLLDGDNEIAVDGTCAVKLAAGDRRLLTLRVELSLEESRRPGLLEGSVTFVSTSAVDASEQERVTHPFKVRIVPETESIRPGLRAILPWLLVAVLLPVIALYAYNYLFGARLALGPRATALLDVQLEDGQLRLRSSESGDSIPLVFEEDLMQFDFNNDRAPRSIRFGRAEFVAKVSRVPWREPFGVVKVDDSTIVVGPDGSDRALRRGRGPLSVTPGWAFWADRVGGDGSVGGAPRLGGMLLLIVPWDVGDISDGPVIFDELVRTASDRVADARDEWLALYPAPPRSNPTEPTDVTPALDPIEGGWEVSSQGPGTTGDTNWGESGSTPPAQTDF